MAESRAVWAGPGWDRLARLAARLVDAPMAVVEVPHDDGVRLLGAFALPEPWATCRLWSPRATEPGAGREAAVMGVVARLGVPLPDSAGVPRGMLWVLDRRPRRWAESARADLADLVAAAAPRADAPRSNRLAAAVFEETLNALLITDDDGRFVAANRAACALLDRPRAQLIGRRLHEVSTSPTDATEQRPAGRPGGEYRLIRRDGEIRLVESSTVAGILPGRHLSILRDVTDRRRTEEALRQSESVVRSFYDTAPLMMGVVDREGDDVRFVSINATCARRIGRRAEELVGRSATESGVDPAHVALWSDHYRRCEQEGRPVDFRVEYDTPDGRHIYHVTLSLIERRVGTGSRFSFVLQDITESTRAEEELRRRYGELSALHGIATAGGRSLQPATVIAALRRSLAEQLGVGGGMICLGDGHGGPPTCRAAWGVSEPDRAAVERQLIARGAAVALRRLPLDEGGREALDVPLTWRGAGWGRLVLFGLPREHRGDDRAAFFEVLGQQVGAMLKNARLFRQIRRGRRRHKALARRLLEAQEAERRHLARELHDEIGQVFTALKLELEAGRAERDPARRAARLSECVGLVDGVIGQVRRLSLDLRPSLLDDLGLVPALAWYVPRLAERAGLIAQLDCEPPEFRLRPEVETACFRVAQEALTNVARHARASRVAVALRVEPSRLVLTIRDDGIGFDVRSARDRAASPDGAGLGLPGMQERAALLGGRLDLRSEPGRGTEVRLELPIEPSR